MLLKLPKEYSVKPVEGKGFVYYDSKERVVFESSKDNTDARFKVWEHYYKDLGTNFLRFYEVEADDNKKLIQIVLAISLVSLVLAVVSFIQQSNLYSFITNFLGG